MIKLISKILSSCEIKLRQTIRSIYRFPMYLIHCYRFKKKSNWPINFYPCLLDSTSGAANLGEYFWQDLYVAQKIIQTNPSRHIDIGSRIDGFIAHLACVRQVEVFDIRFLKHKIKNVSFQQWDITKPAKESCKISDCVTCLHTLEHIGLGRYGDELNLEGWKLALKNISDLIVPGGELWISVPVGKQRVEFNAHRIFFPITISNYASDIGLKIIEFSYLTNNGIKLADNLTQEMEKLSAVEYCLGIFRFSKI